MRDRDVSLFFLLFFGEVNILMRIYVFMDFSFYSLYNRI